MAPEIEGVVLKPMPTWPWNPGTFFLPLLGIHRQVVRDEARMLSEAGRRLEAGVAELHKRMDSRRLTRMDGLNKAPA